MKKKYYHFSSILLGVVLVLLLAWGIIHLLIDSQGELFSANKVNIFDFIGLFFTVTGAVTSLYFIILGVFAYRTQRELDETIAKMEESIEKIELSKHVIEQIQTFHYHALYDFFSDRIANDKQNADKYKLSQARLACLLNAINEDVRAEKIGLLGTTHRNDPTIKEIDDDIRLLKQIINDDDESATIKVAANQAIKELKTKRNNI